jgi:hypothetical protein
MGEEMTYIISDVPIIPDLISQESLDDRLPITIILHRDTHGRIGVNSLESLVGMTRTIGQGLSLLLLQARMMSVGMGMGMGGGDSRYEERE